MGEVEANEPVSPPTYHVPLNHSRQIRPESASAVVFSCISGDCYDWLHWQPGLLAFAWNCGTCRSKLRRKSLLSAIALSFELELLQRMFGATPSVFTQMQTPLHQWKNLGLRMLLYFYSEPSFMAKSNPFKRNWFQRTFLAFKWSMWS